MSNPNFLTSILTGAFYNPPAKVLLPHLKQDTPVILEAEPNNPYDKNAIIVKLDCKHIPQSQHEILEPLLVDYGCDIFELIKETIILGHIAGKIGKPLEKAQKLYPALVSNEEFLKYPAWWPSAQIAFIDSLVTSIIIHELL